MRRILPWAVAPLLGVLIALAVSQLLGITTTIPMTGYQKNIFTITTGGDYYFGTKASGSHTGSVSSYVAATYVSIEPITAYGGIPTVLRLYSADFAGGFADVWIGVKGYTYEGGQAGIWKITPSLVGPEVQVEGCW